VKFAGSADVTATAAEVERVFRRVDPDRARVLLLDADGNLFGSERPAFEASVQVVNRLLHALGTRRRFSADELRVASTGKNFRAVAAELADEHGIELSPEDMAQWVAEEKTAVSRHLGEVLTPDAGVLRALCTLKDRYQLAVVSSSALSRLDVCLGATGLSAILPACRRFSAEDSLSPPTSKPDPAIYLEAAARLGIGRDDAIAIEDSAAGVAAAVAAGFATIGNICFVEECEREVRIAELTAAGACTVVSSWRLIEQMLVAAGRR
jgi:beta-phosphoglucomutase-like phosphatase (HAD superfamily)